MGFRKVWSLTQGDKMYDISGNEVNIDTIVFVDEWIDVCAIDVDNTNNYFLSDLNILVHNKK